MIGAGIMSGDLVVMQKCETAETGSIVVALIDQTEAVFKILRRKGASVALEPANPKYETRIFPTDRVKIEGKLAALLRRY